MSTTVRTFSQTFRQTATKTNNNGTPGTTWVQALPYTWQASVTKDDTKRNYRQLIRNGANATTAMSGTGEVTFETQAGSADLTATYHPNNTVYGYSLKTHGLLLPVSPSDVSGSKLVAANLTSAKNQALTNLYQNLASIESTFKGMVVAGELPKLFAMVRNPARSLRQGIGDYLGALRSRVPRRASRATKRKIVADTYLEYAYGWKPTVHDLDDAFKQFYKSKAVWPLHQMVVGTGSSEVATAPYAGTGTYVGVPVTCRVQRVDTYIAKYYGIYSQSGRGLSDVHRYGWNPTEFVPTLWELIPGSFLVDYFTNIGDILSSWSYRFLGLNWTAQTLVTIASAESVDGRIVEQADTAEWRYDYTGSLGSARVTRKSFTRSPTSDAVYPSLELQVPGFSSTKWLNMAALATSLASTRKHINP